MKILLMVLIGLSIIPVSIVGMMWGWGLTVENWGWVAFSYLWMYAAPASIEALKG